MVCQILNQNRPKTLDSIGVILLSGKGQSIDLRADWPYTAPQSRRNRMDSWAVNAAERDSERQQLALLRMKQSLQDHAVLTANIQLLNARWRSVLGGMVEDFNSQPGKRGMLSVEVNAESCRVWITAQPYCISGRISGGILQFKGKPPVRFDQAWQIKLAPDRLGVWIADSKDAPVTLDEIACTIIEAVLESRWQ